MTSHPGKSSSRRHMVAAVVLGTALSTLGVSPAQARQHGAEASALQDISRYCTACWRNARLPADTWGDCTQEVFTRLMRSLPLSSWQRVFKADGAERQEFVRAIDAVKKRTQRQLKRSRSMTAVVADHRPRDDWHRQEEREAVRQAASQVLSQRQQRILQMSFDGWSVHDMAAELNLAPERVSDEKYKAIRKLRERLHVKSDS